MKRRMSCLLFAVILLFSLASCAGKPDFPVTVKGTDIGALPVKVVFPLSSDHRNDGCHRRSGPFGRAFGFLRCPAVGSFTAFDGVRAESRC